MTEPREKWWPIDMFGTYQVSNRGRVRNKRTGKVLKPDTNERGHQKVKLYNGQPGFYEVKFVHVLVAEAFVGAAPSPEHMVLHKDDDKTNNRPSNLYYGTRKQNAEDARRNGRMAIGQRNGRSKLGPKRVKAARLLHLQDPQTYSLRWLAEVFDVSRRTISDAVKGRTWSHV